MNALKPILLALALMAALPSYSEGASSPCTNSLNGVWSFGQAPKACDLKSPPPTKIYSVLTFDERENFSAEKKRYTQEMHSFLREASDYYLDQRRTNPTASERTAWRRAVMALAHQESYWSHFRFAPKDGALKFMRGDSGYGHGILQIDERWHPKISLSAKGEDLTANIMYGLDLYFKEWERAAKAKCVKKESFEQRARTAYSAYNGGSSNLCRWTKKSKWARNDKNFYAKYKSQDWLKFVAAKDHRSPLDVPCLVEGNEGCGQGVGVEVAFEKSILWLLVPARAEAAPVYALPSSRTGRGRMKIFA